MSRLRSYCLLLVVLVGSMVAVTSAYAAPRTPPVIEVVTLKIVPGTTVETFRAVDRDVERQHVARQPGFLSRESAPGPDGSWLVIVHWRSAADAQASMDSFEKAPAAARFMSLIVPGSMQMTRYGGR